MRGRWQTPCVTLTSLRSRVRATQSPQEKRPPMVHRDIPLLGSRFVRVVGSSQQFELNTLKRLIEERASQAQEPS